MQEPSLAIGAAAPVGSVDTLVATGELREAAERFAAVLQVLREWALGEGASPDTAATGTHCEFSSSPRPSEGEARRRSHTSTS